MVTLSTHIIRGGVKATIKSEEVHELITRHCG